MKPYDFKELAAEAKSFGLDLAEDGAENMAKAFFSWLKKSAVASTTPYDDMAMIVLPQIEKIAFTAIDKIDGKEG